MRLDAAASAEELIGILSAVRDTYPDNKAIQKRIVAETLRALTGPVAADFAKDSDSDDLFDEALEAVREHGTQEEIAFWKSVETALAASPGEDGKAMRAFVRQAILNRFTDAVEEAEEAFESKDAMVKSGLRKNTWTHIKTLKTVHFESLLTEVQRQAAEAQKKDPLTGKQKAAVHDINSILPLLTDIGEKAGIKSGNTPGEQAALKTAGVLHEGYMKWPGQTFIQKLRAEGLAPANPRGSSIDVESAYQESYSKEELVKVRDFLQRELDSGVIPNYNNSATSPMGSEKSAYLEGAIKEINDLIENYPTEKKPDTRKMHASMGLGILAAAGGFSEFISAPAVIVVFAAAAIIFGLWAVRSLLTSKKEEARGNEIQGRAREQRGPSEEVLARAKRLDIMAGRLATRVNAGQFRSRFVGSSGESREGIVPYTNQDVRKIDWKQTAKRDSLQVSRYKQEKDMPLMLIVDVSDSASMGRKGVDKRTIVEDAAALLALTAAHKNIPVGAIFFSDRVEGFIPPGTGKKAAQRIITRMMGLSPTGKGTDVSSGIEFLQRSLKSRAMVAVISDFLSPDFSGPLARIARRHDVRAIRALDPTELQPLPNVGLLPVRDAETGELREVDTSNARSRSEQASKIRSRENRLAETFESNRVRPITLFTDGDYVTDLANEFRSRK